MARVGLSLGFLAGAALALMAIAVTATRPEAFALGLGAVCRASLAFGATTLQSLLPLLILVVAFVTARRLTVRGESGAWMSLGLGPMDAWWSLRALWIACMLLVLLVGFSAEPWAWSTLHRFRGTPAASSAGWARLTRGEAIVLKGGGAVVLSDKQLRFSAREGALEGSLARPRPEPLQVAWSFGTSDVRVLAGGEGFGTGRWRAEHVAVHLSQPQKERYLRAPTNPRTQSPGQLLDLMGLGPEGDGKQRRAYFVVHRRLALAAGVPLLALVGWLLGWSGSLRAGDGTRRSVLLIVVALGLYGITRSLDHLALSGRLSVGLAGWGPWWVALGIVLALRQLKGRVGR